MTDTELGRDKASPGYKEQAEETWRSVPLVAFRPFLHVADLRCRHAAKFHHVPSADRLL